MDLDLRIHVYIQVPRHLDALRLEFVPQAVRDGLEAEFGGVVPAEQRQGHGPRLKGVEGMRVERRARSRQEGAIEKWTASTHISTLPPTPSALNMYRCESPHLHL